MLIQPLIFEEWKDIDFDDIKPNTYKISNFGKIFSLAKNGLLSPAISNGYYTVQLSTINGDRKSFYVHRLVAKAFIENPDPNILTDVNHKNLYRDDDFYGNLEWVTKQENNYHQSINRGHNIRIKSGSNEWGDGSSTYGENNGMAKWKEQDVRVMLSALENGATYKEALIAANIKPTENAISNLSHIARGHRWKYLSKEYNIPKIIPRH